MLRYFGETGTVSCGKCETCITPAHTWDGTIAAQKLLSAVYRLKRERGQEFGAGHIIDILLGKENARVAENNHAALTVFGIGRELPEAEWRGAVRQLLAPRLPALQGAHPPRALTAL